MYSKILVPYDRSEHARHAVKEAIDLASVMPGCTVTVVLVVDRRDFNTETFKIAARMAGVAEAAIDPSMMAGEDPNRDDIAELKEDIAQAVGDHGDIVAYDVITGSPHDAITAYAARGGYDCIVMGHRGLGAVRGMLGSVCYSVLHKTSIPVLIVK